MNIFAFLHQRLTNKGSCTYLGIRATPPVITFLVCLLLYSYLYTGKLFSQEIVLGGDTQLVWAPLYLFYYSLKHFHEVAWWDPTGLNGWPIYYFLTACAYNVFAPFSLFLIVFFVILNLFANIDVNTFIVFQLTTYYFALSLIAVQLISSELVISRTARVFIALTFTLGAIPLSNFRDAYMMAALPTALFYIYGLIHFNQNRTTLSLLILLLSIATFFSTLSYGTALSSLYWTFLFTIFLPVADPTLLPSFFRTIYETIKIKRGKTTLLLGFLCCILAIIAVITPVLINSFDFIRIRAAPFFNYNSAYYGWPPPGQCGHTYELWTLLLTWMPFRELHEVLFKSDIWKAGLDQWYIGLATLPLILVALFFSSNKRYVLLFLLAAFICITYIPYTHKNLIFFHLMEKFQFFQNVRTMPGLLPRGGVLLFFIFVAGMGLDSLLRTRVKHSIFNLKLKILTTGGGLALLLLMGFFSIIFGMFSELSDTLRALKHGLTHFGIYLSLFSILCVMMFFTSKRNKILVSFVLLTLTFTDLTISSSAYWNRGQIWQRNRGPHTLPKIETFGPISSEKGHWAQLHAGVFHHIYAADPFYGSRSWLTLASRPTFEPLLENWNRNTRQVSAYPYFRYFTNGRYVPFKAIQHIDMIMPPEKSGNWFYLHNPDLLQNKPEAKIEVIQKITQFTFNTVVLEIDSPTDGFMVFYDNKNSYWRAYLNEKRVKIYPANFTFKAIKIPSGKSTIKWQFNPYPVKIAWIAFYIVLLAYLLVIFLSRKDICRRKVKDNSITHICNATH